MNPRRVMIIGNAGSGKSTAARKIAAVFDLPVFHMDREVYWLPGWQERSKDDQLVQVKRIVAQETWVFEGSNSGTFHLREARADLLIWLDTPLLVRLWRVIRRNILQQGQVRDDMAPGCTERLDMLPGFLWFILSTWRNSQRKAGAFYHASPLPKHRFTTARAVNQYIRSLT